jgi:site-specific recombinase XerD
MKAKEFEKLSFPRLGEKLREIKEKLEKVRYRVQLTTHLINEHMYAIAKELGISLLPGTNDARHAFATQLKRAGKDIEFVRELLGHLNVKTTQGYYDDFEDETKRGITEHLLPFKKKELSNETAAR